MVYGYKTVSKFRSLAVARQLYEVLECLLKVHGATGRLAGVSWRCEPAVHH